jgi:hypothetical protein
MMIEAVQTLRHGRLRVRTALWLIPSIHASHLAESAARAGIDLVDARNPLLTRLGPNQRFLRLGVTQCIEALDTLCKAEQSADCLLVANYDLLVAGLTYNERKDLWDILYRGFPYRPRALLLAMPATATDLLPAESQLEHWKNQGRLVL